MNNKNSDVDEHSNKEIKRLDYSFNSSSNVFRNRNFKEGDWLCPYKDCNNHNFAKRMYCNRCGANRPDIKHSKNRSSKSIDRFTKKLPYNRNNEHNNSYSNSKNFRYNYNSGSSYNHGLFKEGDWRCSKCLNVNFSWRRYCNKCDYPRSDNDILDVNTVEAINNEKFSKSKHNYSSYVDSGSFYQLPRDRVRKINKNRYRSRSRSRSRSRYR